MRRDSCESAASASGTFSFSTHFELYQLCCMGAVILIRRVSRGTQHKFSRRHLFETSATRWSRGLGYASTAGSASVAFPGTRCLMDEQGLGGLNGKSLINFWRVRVLTLCFLSS